MEELKLHRQNLSKAGLSKRSITTDFGIISPAEYYLFLELKAMGPRTKLQLMRLLPRDILKNLIKHGMLKSVTHKNIGCYEVADGILRE